MRRACLPAEAEAKAKAEAEAKAERVPRVASSLPNVASRAITRQQQRLALLGEGGACSPTGAHRAALLL